MSAPTTSPGPRPGGTSPGSASPGGPSPRGSSRGEGRRPLPSPWSLTGLVARREVTVQLRDKTFLISIGFLLLVTLASVALPVVLEGREEAPVVATVGPAAADLLRDAGDEVALRRADDLAAAERLVREGTADAAVTTGPGGRPEILARRDVPPRVLELVTAADTARILAEGLAGHGVDRDDAAGALQRATAAPPAQRLTDPPDEDEGPARMVFMAFSLLFFVTNLVFGMAIAQSVVVEKQSRIVELLVAAVPVRVLLAGKVLGNTALALGQTVLLVSVALTGAAALGQSDVASLVLRAGTWSVLFFVLGFTMLACLWAVAGALAGRLEDLQATTVPMQLLVMLPFFTTAFVQEEGTALTVASYVPFSAPLAMPRRMLTGDAAWWEGCLSAGLVLLTGVLLVGLASRLYEGALLRTGRRSSLREAWSHRG